MERFFAPSPLRFKIFSAVRFAALGAEDPLSPEFVKDVRLFDYFARTHGQRALVEAVELCLPAEKVRDWTPEAISEALDVLATRLVEHHFADVEVFLEPALGEGWNETLRRVVAALVYHDERRGQPAPARIGIKLPIGGAEAFAAPTAEQIAFALVVCRDASIPLKFRGSLPCPFRRFGEGARTDSHGFVNVFAAGVLAQARGVDEGTLGAILESREAQAFTFGAESFRWHDLEATIEEIETARGEFVLSFETGCFEEPCAHLERLKLL